MHQIPAKSLQKVRYLEEKQINRSENKTSSELYGQRFVGLESVYYYLDQMGEFQSEIQ